MTGASWCDENLVSATRSYWLLSWWESWVTTINMNSKIWYFLEIKHLTKIRKKIKNWHFGETSFGRPDLFLEVIWNHHVSTSNFSTVCPSKRRELVRLRRDLPEHQSRGPKSCFFLWVVSTRWILFPLGDQKNRNIRWTWRNCFT